jgi:hypothetical protein
MREWRGLAAMAAVLAAGGLAAGGKAAPSEAIPHFAGADTGWLLNNSGTDFLPPASGVGPVTNDPKYPHVGNNQGAQPTPRIADTADPNLKPWAAAAMKKANEEILTKDKDPFVAQARCWPGGVPGQLLFPAEPVFFIQTPKEVWIIWQRDHHVRRVYLNRPHSAHVAPSWYGESVGHYEGGNTLVIDTIGLAQKPFSFVDNYRTPHTDRLHVVERWTLAKDGKAIEVSFTADDPGTFNHPWGGRVRYRKVDRGPLLESVCAENNANFFGLIQDPMPEDDTPDF